MKCGDTARRDKVQHDLFYTDACKFGAYLSIDYVECDALRPVWHAFQGSIESLRVMSLLPQAVVGAAVEHLLPLTQAVFNVTGKPVLDDDDFGRHMEAIDTEYDRIVRGFFDGRRKVKHMFGQDLVMYNKHNLVNSPLTKGGFFALLESQVIGVWAAFDTLTTDLCVSAINAEPSPLFNLGQQKIELESLLRGRNHNWTGRMGDLMRLFVRFDSFQNTIEAYKQLFKDFPAIKHAISDARAKAACLIRTQLAHNAGIVTDNFVKQAKAMKLDPWQSAVVNQRLPLDGKNVAALCESVVECANELILRVDDWLKPHAKRAATQQSQGL